jgi:hypothetical protein
MSLPDKAKENNDKEGKGSGARRETKIETIHTECRHCGG